MKDGIESRRYDRMIDAVLEDIEVHRCPGCGEEEVVYRRFDQLNQAVSQMIARDEAQLGPGEIRFLRTYLGLSGTQLAKTMGVAPETVSRWESKSASQSMGTVAERLLRLMVLMDVDTGALETMATKDRDQHEQLRLRFRESDQKWVPANEAESERVMDPDFSEIDIQIAVMSSYVAGIGSAGSPAQSEYLVRPEKAIGRGDGTYEADLAA